MKKKLFIFVFSFALIRLFAQDPLHLGLDCGVTDDVYVVEPDYLGRPTYRFTGVDCTVFTNVSDCSMYTAATNNYVIQWNGSRWQWIASQSNCVWVISVCVNNSISSDVVLATNSANTPYPPQFGWEVTSGNCMPKIFSGYSCNITDQDISQQTVSICSGSSHTVSLSSQMDVNYYLRDHSDNVVAGPVSGTGGTITLNTGNISADETYNVYACSAIDSTNCNLRLTDELTVTVLNCSTKLSTASCGSNLSEMTDALYCDAVPGATNYRYEIRSAIDNSFVATSTTGSSSTLFRMSWSGQVKYGSNYRVRVAAYVDGTWQPYGSVCNVITPLPRLSNCNTLLTTGLDEAFTVTPVQGATDYRIDIRNYAAGFQKVSVRASADNTFRLSWVSGIAYNTTYQVRVSAYVNGSWRNYGPECKVTTPNLSQLDNSSCNITISSLSQALNTNAVSGATNYLFEIRKLSDNSLVAVGTNSSNFYRLSWRPEIQFNTTYAIRVAAYVSGAWSVYGESCNVTTPAAMILEDVVFVSEEAGQVLTKELKIFPNPSQGRVTICTEANADVKVFNELGQIIQQLGSNESGITETDLPAGVYFIRSGATVEKVIIQ